MGHIQPVGCGLGTPALVPETCDKNRHWEVVLARLRLGHTRLTHRYLMEGGRAPVCTNCGSNLTIEHILISCDKYKNQRKNIFKVHFLNGNEPTLKSVLEESNIFSNLDLNL